MSALPLGNQPPRNLNLSRAAGGARWAISKVCTIRVLRAPPDDLMSIAASEGESDFSRDDASAQLPPSGMEAVPDMDLEMMAMLSWWPTGSGSCGILHCVEPSRLDDWFLGVARDGS